MFIIYFPIFFRSHIFYFKCPSFFSFSCAHYNSFRLFSFTFPIFHLEFTLFTRLSDNFYIKFTNLHRQTIRYLSKKTGRREHHFLSYTFPYEYCVFYSFILTIFEILYRHSAVICSFVSKKNKFFFITFHQDSPKFDFNFGIMTVLVIVDLFQFFVRCID